MVEFQLSLGIAYYVVTMLIAVIAIGFAGMSAVLMAHDMLNEVIEEWE